MTVDDYPLAARSIQPGRVMIEVEAAFERGALEFLLR